MIPWIPPQAPNFKPSQWQSYIVLDAWFDFDLYQYYTGVNL